MADIPSVIHVELPLPTPSEITTVAAVRSLIHQLDQGDLYKPALLVERMLWNPRLRAVLGTRLAGLVSTEIRWEPIRNSSDARRAAEEFREDWPIMSPSPQRRQFHKWGLLLGVSFAQRVPLDSPTSGRTLFRLRTYWPGWAHWNWMLDIYRVQTRDRGLVDVPSPSMMLSLLPPSDSPWIVHEPFGEKSFREGLVHGLSHPWFGHDRTFAALYRAAEKYGIGLLKALYPRGEGDKYKVDLGKFVDAIRKISYDGVIPCEQREEPEKGYDVQPLEFAGGTGFEVIDRALNAAAISIAILLLGHNLTTEVKGGSYAAAGVGEYIRSDIKSSDAQDEWATLGPQLAAPWALVNYGDPELAPRAVYVTDPPAVNESTARTYQALGQAIRELKNILPSLDEEALAERFRLPLRERNKAQEQALPLPGVASTPVASDVAASESEIKAKVTLALTPTDLATIVRVDEGRESVGLSVEGGDVGKRWVAEHAALLRQDLPQQEPTAAGVVIPSPSDEEQS